MCMFAQGMMEGAAGFEPDDLRINVRCSATELRPHGEFGGCEGTRTPNLLVA